MTSCCTGEVSLNGGGGGFGVRMDMIIGGGRGGGWRGGPDMGGRKPVIPGGMERWRSCGGRNEGGGGGGAMLCILMRGGGGGAPTHKKIISHFAFALL